VRLLGFEAGPAAPLFLIAGPCVIESPALTQEIAGRLKEITVASENRTRRAFPKFESYQAALSSL